MMMPKNIFVIQYDNKILGHVGNKQSCIFGFIKHKDASFTRKNIFNQPINVQKYKANCYLLKDSRNAQKPLNKRKLSIVTHDTSDIIVQSIVHNIKLELIDDIDQSNTNDIILYSNYNFDVTVPEDFHKATLNALYEEKPIDIDLFGDF